ncbi:MAG: VWA domain-containing protein [Acidobacteria bacterium]|nr:MAG: VWA domain-containing protein [Acidobacteriota bacterium]
MQKFRSSRGLSLTLLLLVAAFPVLAQLPPDSGQKPATPPPVSAKAKEVNLIVTVRDKRGQPVTNLTKQDFVLEQDGRTQAITQFAQDDPPLTIGILADTGPGERKALAAERKAATDFVNHSLREGKDKGFVLHFDKEVELLQDVTISHEKLARGIEQISIGEMRATADSGRQRDEQGSRRQQRFSSGSTLYDAIFLSTEEVLKDQSGRKMLVLFSAGEDGGSKTSLERAIEAAQRANTLVYCVYVAAEREESESGSGEEKRSGGNAPGGGSPFPGGGSPFPGGGSPFPGGQGPFPGGGYPGGGRVPGGTQQKDRTAEKKILQRISKETGGQFFEASKKLTPEQVYSQIADELRHQYSLSFTPDKAESGYHKLRLSTRTGNLTVQTREGFYAD